MSNLEWYSPLAELAAAASVQLVAEARMAEADVDEFINGTTAPADRLARSAGIVWFVETDSDATPGATSQSAIDQPRRKKAKAKAQHLHSTTSRTVQLQRRCATQTESAYSLGSVPSTFRAYDVSLDISED